ncbi:alpha-protein kinase 1 [Melanotaenia boesemani]|uniref:alpha-protein kinase 1 n=1 Tax=Melanotaenia boesemani TaxID=1250792 RepID=UPI001C0437A1|nr:alpha-protein kinase 1 [Melanotaenia boesemani]
MEAGDLLVDCLRAAAALPSTQPSEGVRLNYCRCRDSLCAELASLLQEAMDMKWPFAPEKWQYKQSVDANDKTNLNDLIREHLPQLLALLKAAIMAQEAQSALAVVFLVDRFFYWTDESIRLLKIARLLHQHHHNTPIAPQLVIRQARVYLNSGKLQKAEYILSSLINNSGTTGCWIYQSESDRALVQAVSVQVRGMILQKLGLWLEAAELIWASLVGYYSLPQPDKKGIGTSLGILANILVSMNDEDFHAFRTNSDIDFPSLLGDGSHRLLSAAQAAKMAVIYSQYTSLYVLTNVTTQGTCLLSYSFSLECPSSQRESYLRQAREAFAIGLLTKTEGDLVTSQQELHTFLKAAYSITVVQKWLNTPREVVAKAAQICQKGLEKFYNYCHVGTQKKDGLSAEVMHLIAQVKLLLGVDPMPNSDKGSFIPDSYRSVKDSSVHFTLEGFSKIMQRFQKYHATLCKTTTRSCKGTKDETDGAEVCLTAVGTTIGTLSTEGAKPNPTQKSELCKSKDNLGSSWQKISLSSSGSPRPSSSGYTGSIPTGHAADANDQSCVITEGYDDMSDGLFQSPVKNKKQNPQGCNPGFSSYAASASAIPITSSKSQNDSEAGKETVDTDLDWMDDVVMAQNQSDVKDAVQSLSQLTLKTLSSSLGDSFGSQSSWEKISDEHNSPMNTKPQPSNLPKAGTIQGHKSPDSDESFFVMETLDLETDDLAHVTYKNHKSAQVVKASPKPQPLQSRDVYLDTKLETDSVPAKPATSKASVAPCKQSQAVPNQYEATETSTESSFELLEVEENQNGHQPNSVTSTENKKVPEMNPLCYSCLNPSKVAVQQFLLSQQDYQALLAGVCHDCLLRRLYSDKRKFQLSEHQTAYSALHLKFSKATGLWTARETCVYIGELMGLKGKQRAAIWVQFLHQEERLSSYVGKDYLEPRGIQFHLKDVERQMTAQYYVTQFNKSLYDKDDMAQIFFIPSEALLILNGDEIVGCVTVEPYMLGDFVKLTNNAGVKDMRFKATDYGLAFGHFTYQFSDGEEVVVDLQGWVTANGKGLTYLTDPQIHSTRTPKGPANFADRGLRYFLEEQHGPECNEICRLLKLRPFPTRPCVLP